jgi:signal transduction histidine kinase
LLIADHTADIPPVEQTLLQSQQWEAVGRMAGGVVHDFNNLFTGVMLYCDLLLSNLDARDCRRRYATEIRSAITQAASLGRQLLLFARPRAVQVIPLCINHVAQGMQDLLTGLIGESVTLDLRLEPDLGQVKIDESQVQQILLNLVLNARDAMPEGGRIVVETSNCKVRSVPGSPLPRPGDAAFPCVLLVVSDNGRGMDDDTRQHVFEPFFTTKTSGQGTGLGLTTVHSIVTANRGLIHLESELGRGTRAMILFPLAPLSPDPDLLQDLPPLSPTPLDEPKKESFL